MAPCVTKKMLQGKCLLWQNVDSLWRSYKRFQQVINSKFVDPVMDAVSYLIEIRASTPGFVSKQQDEGHEYEANERAEAKFQETRLLDLQGFF
ncbi:hypothetical protein MTBLM1_120010 [Rhodospirillaceae bacterium LM-1]|nr:hypothetical protein MTBLM1_120010 [Rhodospirillaceae bacterium LM-1]